MRRISHSSTALISKQEWKLLLFLFVLFQTSCAPRYNDPAVIADTVDPMAIFAQLSNVDTINAGSDQFATALNLDPTLVRIRIQPGGCTVCRLESTPQLSKIEGLTVDEATKLVEKKDQVSFFVPKFSCTFLVESDGTLMPQSCQRSPI